VRASADGLRRLVWSDCKLCKSAIAVKLFAVTTFKYRINPVTNPNPVTRDNNMADRLFTFTPRANVSLQIVGQQRERNQGGMRFVKNVRNIGGRKL
jgi:hypothetical protein